MIAFIRARFPGTPAGDVWPDTIAANWMDPSIPFSMAHYWKRSTFGQVNMSHVMFPPVVVNDPRQGGSDDRQRLIQAVLQAVDQAHRPNWDQFDRCIIVFAQQTDCFGGVLGSAPNGRLISGAVFDVLTRFDVACQEIGHGFGLQHELGDWRVDSRGNYTNEYGCPYSVMSAGRDLWFDRDPDPRLPGLDGPTHPARGVGPYIPAAHLHINQSRPVNPQGEFNHAETVSSLPATFESTPVNLRLHARDVAIAAWPNRVTVLAVVPPIVPGADTHFLELRRKDGSYDDGIDGASIVILAANVLAGGGPAQNPGALRLQYVGRIDLEGVNGDLDYHSFSGRFVVRVTHCAPDFAFVNLSIGGANAWQDFRLSLDEQVSSSTLMGVSEWSRALVAPCPASARREFKYRVNTYRTFMVVQARSAGYEAPAYSWKVGGALLDPAAGTSRALQVRCRTNEGHLMSSPGFHPVAITFEIRGARLELDVRGPFADIDLEIEVTVSESSPSVMKNYYPGRTVRTSVRVDNLGVEWDAEYQAATGDCWKRLRDSYMQIPQQVVPHGVPRYPDPAYFERLGVRELIRVLTERDPQAARSAAGVVAGMAAVSVEHVLEAALLRIQGP